MAETCTRRGFGGALVALGGLGFIGFLGLSGMATAVQQSGAVNKAVVVGDVVVQGEDGHATDGHGGAVVDAMLATLVGVVTGDPGWWKKQEDEECVDGRLRPQIKMAGGEWHGYTAQFVFEKIAEAGISGEPAIYQFVTGFVTKKTNYLKKVREKCHGPSGPAFARGSIDAATV